MNNGDSFKQKHIYPSPLYISNKVFILIAAIEKDLWASGTVNDEYLKALNSLFTNFPRLRATEPATLSIPHLVTALKTGSEACQEAALDALFLLRQAWSACPVEVSRAQSIAAADAIPLLQYLIQSGPPRFQEKAEFLLQCLPGTLVVIIKRGNNMKQSVGNPSVYCKLTLGNTPPRQTQVIILHLWFRTFLLALNHLCVVMGKRLLAFSVYALGSSDMGVKLNLGFVSPCQSSTNLTMNAVS